MTRNDTSTGTTLSLTGVLEGDWERNEHILVPAPPHDCDRAVYREDRVELRVEPVLDEEIFRTWSKE